LKPLHTGFFRRQMIVWSSAAIPCRSSGCDPPPACVASCLAPRGDSSPTWLVGCHVLALLPGCPRPPPMPATNSDMSVPSSPRNDSSNTCPTRRQESIQGVPSLEKKYRTSRAGDHNACVQIIIFKLSVPNLSDRCRSRGSHLQVFIPPNP
jgi:hypothetical protein